MGWTRRAEAFADDLTLVTTLNQEILFDVRRIMENFEKVSGLGLNVAKTVVMPIGGAGVPVWGQLTGFGFDDKLKVLGHTLDPRRSIASAARNEILRRVARERNKWAKYGLTLPGRIRVAKCFVHGHWTG